MPFQNPIADLHTHTFFSDGLHSHLEVIEIAKKMGLQAIGISDHGQLIIPNQHLSIAPFIKRFPDCHNGLRVFKGIEANVTPEFVIDYSISLLHSYDYIMVGFHEQINPNHGEDDNTEFVINVLRKFPIDVIAHPCTELFPLNFRRLAPFLISQNVVLELNNCQLRYSKDDIDKLEEMLEMVRRFKLPVMINSDGHVVGQIGCFEEVIELLKKFPRLPKKQIINSSLGDLESFIQLKKSLRAIKIVTNNMS